MAQIANDVKGKIARTVKGARKQFPQVSFVLISVNFFTPPE
jgi:hypothetical protein